mgnify:CR=1 FL=1
MPNSAADPARDPEQLAAALRAGDRLRLGHPGVELELMRVVDGDGAP